MPSLSDLHDELTCRELVEQVTNYLERALDPHARARFTTHLRACEGCRDHLDQMLRTIALLRLSSASPAPPPDHTQLFALLRELRRTPPADADTQ